MLPDEIAHAHGLRRQRYKLSLGQSKIFIILMAFLAAALTAVLIYLLYTSNALPQ